MDILLMDKTEGKGKQEAVHKGTEDAGKEGGTKTKKVVKGASGCHYKIFGFENTTIRKFEEGYSNRKRYEDTKPQVEGGKLGTMSWLLCFWSMCTKPIYTSVPCAIQRGICVHGLPFEVDDEE